MLGELSQIEWHGFDRLIGDLLAEHHFELFLLVSRHPGLRQQNFKFEGVLGQPLDEFLDSGESQDNSLAWQVGVLDPRLDEQIEQREKNVWRRWNN